MQYFSSKHKLGILGGGQLGKMLLYNTRKFDIHTMVLDPSNEAPCKLCCNSFVQGDLMDFDTVYEFGKKVDTLTIEIENVNVKALEALEKEGVKVYPDSNTISIIQNKSNQKLFYLQKNLPSSPYKSYKNKQLLEKATSENFQRLPFVWKSARFGYDGNGVKIIRRKTDLKELPNVECIAEELVSIKNELAVIVAQNIKGEIKAYPVVEMEFNDQANQVEYVLNPARISNSTEKKAKDLAIKTAEAFKNVGLLAVEMFLTENDSILINEVAPRPHNSGHQTIETSHTSQFEQHLRAILNLPLGSTENIIPGIMVNLVGAKDFKGPVVYKNIEKIMSYEGVNPHIYGKKYTWPFRKMGHVTIVNQNIEKAKKIAKKVKELVKVISE